MKTSLVLLLIMTMNAMICRALRLQCRTTLSAHTRRSLQHPSLASTAPTVDDTAAVTNRDKEENYMRLALRHAQHAFREKEVPIGAVIVDGDGVVLATSRNQVEGKKDVTAHAEIDCLRKASKLRSNWRLTDCTMYSTLEPCPMCLGAIQASRLKRIVYAAADLRVGACGSWVDLVASHHPYHSIEVKGGLLQEESSILLKRFFQMRRRESKTENSKTASSTEQAVPVEHSQEEFIDRGLFMKSMLEDGDDNTYNY